MTTPADEQEQQPTCPHVTLPRSCFTCRTGRFAEPEVSEQGVTRLAVTVTVDTDDLRKWAEWHADRGHHGVAHVLYKAASEGESLSKQALREAKAAAVRSMAHLFRDMSKEHLTRREVIDLIDLRAASYGEESRDA